MGFDLSAYLKDLPVSESDTEERIEYLELDALHSDTRNFYELSDLEGLADNIATIGLQQPIRVRKEADAYYIISGHRRAAALRMLAEDGREDLRRVPCIVERSTGSKALDELKLIYANANTRKMTSAETAAQVSRVERLLYELKEEGFDFPGRMRDHVAEACSVSRTRIANLKTIEGHLTSGWRALWRNGTISEDAALALARMPEEDQTLVYAKNETPGKSIGISTAEVKGYAAALGCLPELRCRDGSPCSNLEARREEVASKSGYNGASSSCRRCCSECVMKFSCPHVCQKLSGEIAELQAAKKKLEQISEENRKQAAAARKAAEKHRREKWAKLWDRFGQARRDAGMSINDAMEHLGSWIECADDLKRLEANAYNTDIDVDTTPFGEYIDLDDLADICGLADRLGCTTDYLLLRSDSPNPPKAELSDAGAHWSTGKPPKAGLYYARFIVDGHAIETSAVFDSIMNYWKFKHGAKIEAECTGWWPLPEDDA